MPKYPLYKVIIVSVFCFATQLFSMSIQQKFNEFLNSLLGGYTLSLSHMLSGGKKPVVVAVPPYITFDLNVTETTGELAFIINEKNMQYIVSKNDIEKINKLKAFCTQENEKIRTLKEKLVAMRWIQFIRPYIKTNLEDNINALQSSTLKQVTRMIEAINKHKETIIKLTIHQKNNQYSISWDPDINNLLYSKISTITAIYTLFEGLKPLVKEDKKLNAIHQKWQTIEKITNIQLKIRALSEELKVLSKNFAEMIQENLDRTGQYFEIIKTYVLNSFAALVPYLILGTTQLTISNALVRVFQANVPDTVKRQLDEVFKTKVSLFQSSEKISPFLTFVENNDEIEKELIDIFSFELTQDAEKIITLDIKKSIAMFNQNLEKYLENCLLGYSDDNRGDIATFNRNKAEFANPLHRDFKVLKQMLLNYPNILLEQKDSKLIIKITSLYETQIQIANVLSTIDQKTQDKFEAKIKEILANPQTNSEEKLSALKELRLLAEEMLKDTKKKNVIVQELHHLISTFDQGDIIEYATRIEEIKNTIEEINKKNFTTEDKRNQIISELLTLKTEVQDILSKKPKSRTQQFKTRVTRTVVGWITDEERVNLKRFIDGQYEKLVRQYRELPAETYLSRRQQINKTKNEFLINADRVVVKHDAEELQRRVEKKVQEFKKEILELFKTVLEHFINKQYEKVEKENNALPRKSLSVEKRIPPTKEGFLMQVAQATDTDQLEDLKEKVKQKIEEFEEMIEKIKKRG